MELSLSFTLPRNLLDRNIFINDLEIEMENQGFKIVSRQINDRELLVVYENYLSAEETKQFNKYYSDKYQIFINGKSIKLKHFCIGFLGLTLYIMVRYLCF